MNKRNFEPHGDSAAEVGHLASPPKRILVVDDDPAVRTTLMEVLVGEGYAAVPAGGGLQAVALAARTPPDLVLLDLNLLGQNGWDTFQSLAASHPHLPIIIITARPGQEAQANRLRADALMEKPLNLPLLLETMAGFLAESRAQRAERRSAPGFRTCCLSLSGHGALNAKRSASDQASPGAPLPAEKADGKTRPAPGPKRILVVDDDSSVRLMLGRILSEEGYAVSQAADGDQALERAAREPLDLMLLDLNMPVKNGWDTFERLTTQNPWLPVIIITARPHQVFTAFGAGVGALLEKPLDFPKLLQTIEVLLTEPPEVHLARLAGKRAEFYYQPAGLEHESHECMGKSPGKWIDGR
jgi:DNA-binding response OmpR family regulator